ncbi:uncharacterized protein LOC116341260 [Contarinia nasturtii]|uniref:uncharacterized protein LOC116341260 n=1 Tax=Contarinia nasturtii TaxID=265458 RepID=UPI0012D3A10B|nr:uncharacterized protein LOC116341260 [Contarinia nasturtii]
MCSLKWITIMLLLTTSWCNYSSGCSCSQDSSKESLKSFETLSSTRNSDDDTGKKSFIQSNGEITSIRNTPSEEKQQFIIVYPGENTGKREIVDSAGKVKFLLPVEPERKSRHFFSRSKRTSSKK